MIWEWKKGKEELEEALEMPLSNHYLIPLMKVL